MIQFFDASFGDDASLGGKCAGPVAQTAAGRCPQEVEWAIEGADVFLLRCSSTVGGPVVAGRPA